VPSMVHASGTFAVGGELVVHRLAAAGIELSEEDLGELGSASAAAGGAHAQRSLKPGATLVCPRCRLPS